KEINFKGVVDLLSMKCHTYEADLSGAGKESEIPADLKQKAQEMREKLVEKIAEQDDALIEKYFEAGALTDEELVAGIKKGIENNTLVPVLCGSASLLFGIDRLLDFINAYFPDPLCRKLKVKKSDGTTGEWKPAAENPFTGYVFKTIIDPYAGKLTLFRVFSGTLNADSSFYNGSIGAWERFGSIYKLVGKKQVPVGTAVAGDIVAIAKLKDTRTANSLAADEKQPLLEGIKTPPPSISFAVKPRTQGDEDKVSSALQKLIEEDIGITLGRDEEAKEFLIHGMGQSHVETTVEKMKSKFGVDVELKPPKIPYRETIKSSAKDVEGKHKKQSGGRGQFGVCYIDLEPQPRGAGFEFVNDIFGGSIPRNFIPSVEKGITEAMARGVIAGYPVVDVRVRLFDGKYHDVDSDNRSFEIAGSKGFKLAFKQAKPCLLEPIMNMEIVIPDEDMGTIIGDINSRRGKILGMDSKGRNQVVKAQVPMAEVLKYSSDLRSMTSGRGTFTMEFSHYEEVPAMIAEKIVSAVQLKEEEE
ncbi:MAG: elongation factor G, partial [Deltaproteobacteria bacterium]|nr:elongation factor G [Deltaproteobacteria bacterium]